MTSQQREELIAIARANRACREALGWVARHPDATLAELPKDYGKWLATHCCLPEWAAIELERLGRGRSWWRDGVRHRDGGPAVVWPYGMREWWRDGKRHRDDGPAVVWPDGTQKWFRNGKLHRDDGPAVVWPDAAPEWWRDGVPIPAPGGTA